MLKTPLTVSDLRDLLGDPALGRYHLVLELDVDALHYMVISSTQILGSRMQPREQWRSWAEEIDRLLSLSSSPLSRQILSTFRP